jgi:hypothetical protein
MILDRHEMASVHNAPRLPEGRVSVLVGRHGAMNPSSGWENLVARDQARPAGTPLVAR